MSPEISERLTNILIKVVEKGTGIKAKIKGVKVAGKTGTSQKIDKGKYSNQKYYATFFGFAPAEDPKIAVIVIFDEPRPYYFGGVVSAPVFKRIVEKTLKYLSIDTI